jgi:hypothetical protein
MGAKEKLIGIILIIVGAFPLLMKITSFSDLLKQYSSFISYITIDSYIYPIIIIVLGVLLIYSPKPKQNYPYPRR